MAICGCAVGPQPAQHADEVAEREAHAPVRRPAGLGVEEDPRPEARHDGVHVELDDREVRIRGRRRGHVRRRRAEGRPPAAADPLERVVRARARVLDPPVAAAEAHVAEANARIRPDAVHRPADREGPDGCRPVSLAPVAADAVPAHAGCVRSAGRAPASGDAAPRPQRRMRRPRAGASTVTSWCRPAVGAVVGDVRGAGGDGGRRQGGGEHRREGTRPGPGLGSRACLSPRCSPPRSSRRPSRRRRAGPVRRRRATGPLGGAAWHLPRGLPDRPGGATHSPADALGLRRPPAHGLIVVHRRVARDVVAVFRRLYAARFPIRRDAARVALRRQRRPVDGRGQHVGVQLPPRGPQRPVVAARLRARGRPQPAREPVPRAGRGAAARRPALPRPVEAAARAWSSRATR